MVKHRNRNHRSFRRGLHPGRQWFLLLALAGGRVQRLAEEAARRVGQGARPTRDPHITLAGPFLFQRGKVPESLSGIMQACAGTIPSLSIPVRGTVLLRGRGGYYYALRVSPSPAFVAWHEAFRESLLPLVVFLSPHDSIQGDRQFHVSLLSDLRHVSPSPQWQGEGEGKVCPDIDLTAFRVVIASARAVRGGWDICRGAWLNRAAIFSPAERALSIHALRARLDDELTAIRVTQPAGTAGPYVTADLHLGHGNIIRYCDRPFTSVHEMDEALIASCNAAAGPGDELLVLGDLTAGPGTSDQARYLAHFRARVRLLPGNHDRSAAGERSLVLEVDGVRFLLVHDPADAPGGFEGYVVHGHHHNNDLGTFPFFNPGARRFNVSTEVTGYRPLPLRLLAAIARDGGGPLRTVTYWKK